MKKIGIYAPWASGDAIISSSILKYKEEVWPNCYLIWFYIPEENTYAASLKLHLASKDIMSYNPWISELRPSLDDPIDIINLRIGKNQHSFGRSPGPWPSWMQLSVDKMQAGLISPDKKCFQSVMDLDLCFFPAPWANCDHLDMPFSHICKQVFNFPPNAGIHPCLFFSSEEDKKAEQFIRGLPFKYSIMMETQYGSNQSNWNDKTTESVMLMCRQILGDCNFVFSCPGSHQAFKGLGVTDCSDFTIRQCIPVFNRCDLFLGTASGVTQAICSWSALPVRRIELVDDPNVRTTPIARGLLESVPTQSQMMSCLENVLKKNIGKVHE